MPYSRVSPKGRYGKLRAQPRRKFVEECIRLVLSLVDHFKLVDVVPTSKAIDEMLMRHQFVCQIGQINHLQCCCHKG